MTVGSPVALERLDADDDTEAIMAAIVDLLPAEARVRREPTPEELAATLPGGAQSDASAAGHEASRRPGTD